MERKFKKIKKVAAGVGAVLALTFVSLCVIASCSANNADEILNNIKSSQDYKEYSSYVKTSDGVAGYVKSRHCTEKQKAEYNKFEKSAKTMAGCLYTLPLLAIAETISYAFYCAAKNAQEKVK